MNIILIDLDYYHKKATGPNPMVMRLSSYLKQKGHSINFVEDEAHLKMSFDEVYVFREREDVKGPPSRFLDSEHCYLIGKTFELFTQYTELPAVVTVTRPDYSLYNYENLSAMSNSEYIEFFYKGTLLKKRQDFHNTIKGRKHLIVLDEGFWCNNPEDIIWALNFLSRERGIEFKYPIRISYLLKDKEAQELFLKLKFKIGARIIFKNDIGHSLEQIKQGIQFVNKVDVANKRVASAVLTIAAITSNHFKHQELAQGDFFRVMEAINYAKSYNVRLQVKAPANRKFTPYFTLFEFFDYWTTYYSQLSFIHAIVLPTCKLTKLKWWEILNHSQYWTTQRVKIAVMLLSSIPDFMKENAFRKEFEEFDDYNKIDFIEISKWKFKQEKI